MYLEVKKYYVEYLDKAEITDEEKKEILLVTKNFFQINLLTVKEYEDIKDQLSGAMSRRIVSLPFSKRIHTALERERIYSFRQLREILINVDRDERLFSIRNLGKVSIKEIIDEACNLNIVTYEEIYNAGWTYGRKTVIEEILA